MLYLGLIIRLWREGLHTKYPAFLTWLGFELISGVALYLAPARSNLYGEIYVATSVVGWAILYFVLRELCLLLFADHPGIAAAVRMGIWVSFGAAIVVTAGILLLTPDVSGARFPLLRAFFSMYQAVMFFFCILFVGTIAFVAWFPVVLRRNTIAYCVGFSVGFVVESTATLAQNVIPESAGPYLSFVTLFSQVLSTAILMIWIVLLNRAGERTSHSVGHRWRPDESRQVLDRLEDLNETLANAFRGPRH